MQYGRYEIAREVGRGSMGVVYEAHDPNIGRRVALKALRQDRMTDEAFVRRFMREARAIGRLSHPNIVAVYDVGEDQGGVYIAMEFLEGSPLNEIMRDQTFTMEQVVDLGIQAAETLDYAHQKGVVHRDIKPSNIVVQADGRIKITDFGIAHIEDGSGTVATQVGEIMGTPAYMSPEQVLGKAVDGRTDIFSLGALLYELSTGKRPFGGEGKGLPTIFNEIINIAPLEPVASAPLISAGLSRIIMKCLAKVPEERFQTGKELADELRRPVETETTEPPIVPTPGAQPQPPLPPVSATTEEKKRSHTALIVLIVVLLMISGMGVGGFFLYPRVKGFMGLESLGIPNIPWMKKAAEEKPLEEKAVAGQQPAQATEEKPAKATLKIQSQPAGALITVDGESKGKSPLSLEVPLGTHRVRFALQGYEDREEEIQTADGKEYSLSARLERVPVKITVEQGPDETIRKTPAKRSTARSDGGAGVGTMRGEQPRIEQPRVAVPPPVVNQPQTLREPKRENPSDGWIIKDLRDR